MLHHHKAFNRFSVAAVTLLLAVSAQAQTVYYVDDDAPLGGDGTSWSTAFKFLQDALGERLFTRYLDLKQKEWHEFSTLVHDWERKKYLDV